MIKKSNLLFIILLVITILTTNGNLIGMSDVEEMQKNFANEMKELSINEFKEDVEKRKIIRERTFMFRYLCNEGLKNYKSIENVLFTKFRNNKWKLTSNRHEINEHRTYIFEKAEYQCEIYLYNTHIDFCFRKKGNGF